MKNKTLNSKYFWKKFAIEYWEEFSLYVNPEKEYGNTNLTRFYMDYNDKSICSNKIEKIKTIWKNKKILIVEGSQTKLGVGNDLFDN